MSHARPDSDVQRVPKWRGVFVAAIALLLLTGGLSIHQYFRYSAASQRLDHAYQAISGIDELSARLLDVETAARGYLLTGSASFLDAYDDARPRVAEAAGTLSTVIAADARQRLRAGRLAVMSRDRTNQLQSAVDAYKAGRTSDAVGKVAPASDVRPAL